jgi:hypothetical protein
MILTESACWDLATMSKIWFGKIEGKKNFVIKDYSQILFYNLSTL